VKIAWLTWANKTALVQKVCSSLWSERDTFYFNSQVYKNARIKNAAGLKKLLAYAEWKKAVDTTSLLIFESVEDIENIKDLMTELFAMKKYKIILIWSLKHLQWLPTITLPVDSILRIDWFDIYHNLEAYSTLWWLYNFDYSWDVPWQIIIRDALKDSTILQDIIIAYWVKDIFLYQSMMSFLSRNIGKYLSLRDITKLLNEWNLKTSVITITDYVNNSADSGLIYKVKRFDFKKDAVMNSKGSYYFWDMWLLASFKRDTVTHPRRKIENLLFIELLAKGYEVYSWVNGKFEFSFYTKKLWKKMCIQVTKQTDKKELKKEINKLWKIDIQADRFLVVESLDELWLRKKDYDTVQVIEYIDMLKLI
jgi:hypothetical protein